MSAAAVSLTTAQSVPVSIQDLDANGTVLSPVIPFDAPPTWTSDTPSVATVSPATDGMSATVVAVAAGSATITATTVEHQWRELRRVRRGHGDGRPRRAVRGEHQPRLRDAGGKLE